MRSLTSDNIIMDEHFFFPLEEYKDVLNDSDGLVFLPVYGLSIRNKIKINNFTLYPAFRINWESFYIKGLFPYTNDDLLDEEKYHEIKSKKKEYLDVFARHALLAFSFEINYEIYLSSSWASEIAVVEHLSSYAEVILNIIRYYEFDYSNSMKVLPSPGYCADGFSTSLTYIKKLDIFRVHAGRILKFIPASSRSFLATPGDFTLLSKYEELENNALTNSYINEVGNIAKHALFLNSLIINSSSNNLKFILIMQLIDFLMLPYKYANFKKIKGNFICHIAQNKQEYHSLSERFKELTGPDGLRTKIMHGGFDIDDLLSFSGVGKCVMLLD